MKTKETKQKDLTALTESLQSAKSAMVVSFSKLTVNKDIEFRNNLREAGAKYQVVKNTLARIAVKDTQYEQATEHFKGVTAIAWTENDPVILSKAVSKFMKDDEEGQTLVEYGLLLALIAIIVIVALLFLGPIVSRIFQNVGSNLQGTGS